MKEKLANLSEQEAANVRMIDSFLEKNANVEPVHAVEKDTLRFIRQNVLAEIARETKPKKSWPVYFKIAAAVAFIAVQITLFKTYDSSSDNRETARIENEPLYSDARAVLSNFSGLSEDVPPFLLQINIDEAKKILDQIKLAREKANDESLLEEIEPILIGIASLESTKTFLEVRLIQENLKDKQVIAKLKKI